MSVKKQPLLTRFLARRKSSNEDVIRDEGSYWALKFESSEMSPAETSEFNAWLLTSTRHKDAFFASRELLVKIDKAERLADEEALYSALRKAKKIQSIRRSLILLASSVLFGLFLIVVSKTMF